MAAGFSFTFVTWFHVHCFAVQFHSAVTNLWPQPGKKTTQTKIVKHMSCHCRVLSVARLNEIHLSAVTTPNSPLRTGYLTVRWHVSWKTRWMLFPRYSYYCWTRHWQTASFPAPSWTFRCNFICIICHRSSCLYANIRAEVRKLIPMCPVPLAPSALAVLDHKHLNSQKLNSLFTLIRRCHPCKQSLCQKRRPAPPVHVVLCGGV